MGATGKLKRLRRETGRWLRAGARKRGGRANKMSRPAELHPLYTKRLFFHSGVPMVSFGAPQKAFLYPPDRRFRIWIKPSFVAGLVALILIPLLFAWGQGAIFGLPYIPPVPQFSEAAPTGPHGFPVWIRYAHFFQFLLCDDADPQWSFNSHGPSSALF